MCHRNNFMYTTENNYMYCSTLNLFSTVHDKKKKKKYTKKGTAVHLICSKKYLRRCSTIMCTIVQLYVLQYTKVNLQYKF